MTKRIVRAKRKIVEAGICFWVPQGEELRDRLSEVLTSVYAMFGESYLSSGPDATERAELAAEAEWFATLLHQLMPEEPEVTGLLALIRLNQARRLARFDSDEHLILLKDQNRGLWDRAAIEDAVALLNRALAASRPGPFQAQAAIAACHALTRRREDTGWDRIVALYDTLLCLGPSPIASLNRAIALRQERGPEEALKALDPLAEALSGYHLYHAARAELLRDLGRRAESESENMLAAGLTRNPAELHLLQKRIEGLA